MNSAGPSRAVLSELRLSLAGAADAQVARVVAMVDRMAERGAADELIAPLRPRLAQLRPARRLSVGRLLFLPLDPLIAPAATWHSQMPALPRPILAPLGRAVQARLGALWAEIAQELAAGADERAGRRLWADAAEILARLPRPDDWRETGLADTEYAPVRAAVVLVLRHADTLIAPDDAADEMLRSILAEAASLGGTALAMLIALLLARLGQPGRVLLLAAGLDGRACAGEAERAVCHVIGRLGADLSASTPASCQELGHVAGEMERLAALLDGLEALPGQRRRAVQMRRDADATARASVGRAIESSLIEPLGSLRHPASDEEMDEIERRARALRRLDDASRAVGAEGAALDALLRDGASRIALQPDAAITRVDRLRLVEILLGPDAAMALLG